MKRIHSLAVFLLTLLWAYAAVSKLAEFRHFQLEMLNQLFTKPVALALSYLVPSAELIAAALLCYRRCQYTGLILSAAMMFAFSVYISLVIARVFRRVPCSCGGILKNMGWEAHLVFNLAFLSLAVAGIVAEHIYHKERRERQEVN